MDLGLEGKTALVTGAARGIGLATARAFAEEGCSLLLWDIDARVHSVALHLSEEFEVSIQSQVVDLVAFEPTQLEFEAFLHRGGTIQHVVHCAAMGSGKFGFPFTNLQPGDWPRTLEVNVLGMVNLAHLLTPHLVAQAEGTFVFLASVAGQIGSQTDPPYSASKAANINFSQCMAKDLAQHGIRVNTVCPGMVQTDLNQSVWKAWLSQVAESEAMSYQEWAEKKIESVVPLKRWQSCEDVASMVVFLSSQRACQVTGQTINVDGGFVMHC